MQITYTFNSAGLLPSALHTHQHGAEAILKRYFPVAEVSVQHSAGAAYSVVSDDPKTQKAAVALMRQTHGYVFHPERVLAAMAALANIGAPA